MLSTIGSPDRLAIARQRRQPLTIYSVISGQSPFGLPSSFYGLDNQRDAARIKSLQETVWQVVAACRHCRLSRISHQPVGRIEQLVRLSELRSPNFGLQTNKVSVLISPVALFRQNFRRPRSGLRDCNDSRGNVSAAGNERRREAVTKSTEQRRPRGGTG